MGSKGSLETGVVDAERGGENAALLEAELEGIASADLERKLVTMSRDGAEFDAELWTEAALRNSEHWAEVRVLAQSALEALAHTEPGITPRPFGFTIEK